jgi:hypothetical protein
MKRKKKRLVEEFEKLLQGVIPGNYFFSYPYQQDTINLWWWGGKEPKIDIINRGNGEGYIIDDFSKTPLPVLKVLVKELTKREKKKWKMTS